MFALWFCMLQLYTRPANYSVHVKGSWYHVKKVYRLPFYGIALM